MDIVIVFILSLWLGVGIASNAIYEECIATGKALILFKNVEILCSPIDK